MVSLHVVVNVHDPPVFEVYLVRLNNLIRGVVDVRQLRRSFQRTLKDCYVVA